MSHDPAATWDVFHSDRLEVQRSLTTAAVRAALARGDLREDDLIRPAGTTGAWQRLADLPTLRQPPPSPVATGPDQEEVPAGPLDLNFDRASEGHVALPIVDEDFLAEEEFDPFDPLDEDEAAAGFTLSRGAAERVEELDLAAMVDVAFQLVLFFLVTATTVFYKTLEVPRPSPDRPPAAATQGQNRTLEDLEAEYILVEVDARGAIRVDHAPVPPEALIERLRRAREDTARTALLLSADFATPHRHAVLAYDAANEIGLRIAIAKPAGPAPGPPPPAARKAVGG